MQPSTIQIPSRRNAATPKDVLSGRTFLVTRTPEGNAIERKKLQNFGAKVIELPSIKISPPTSWKKLDRAISKLEEFDWIVFTSANGVNIFFDRLRQRDPKLFAKLRSQKAGGKPRYACVGPATRSSLEELGLRCSFQPKEFLTEKLGKELASPMNVTGKKILLARAQVANKQISRILRGSGAKVSEAPVYRTVMRVQKLEPTLLRKITDITLTSPSTVKGLLISLDAATIKSHGIPVHCIGPVTAKAAKARGLKVENVAKVHTIDGLVRAIASGSSRKRS